MTIADAVIIQFFLLKMGMLMLETCGGLQCNIHKSAVIRHTVQPFTENDDTGCCNNITCPPEGGHVDARNMSRIGIISSTNFNAQFSLFINNVFVTLLSPTCFEH